MRKPIQGLLGLGDPEYDYLILQALSELHNIGNSKHKKGIF
jgi:hypothetical protein